jgi:class 3 adenylate cyclase
LAEAINVAKAIGAVTEEARARLDLARALARSGNVAAAAEQARSAAELAGALSMEAVASDANALAAELSRPAVALDLPQSSAMAVILFTDVVGSTELTERIGDAAYRTIADRLNAELRDIIDTCGGATIPGITLGDGIVALFGSASGALDFAGRAHGCANGLELSLRIGVHAGDVIRAGEVVSGGAVNVAARICAAAEPSETLVSETVRSLARTSAGVAFDNRGEHDLKGVSVPYRLYSARSAAH